MAFEDVAMGPFVWGVRPGGWVGAIGWDVAAGESAVGLGVVVVFATEYDADC